MIESHIVNVYNKQIVYASFVQKLVKPMSDKDHLMHMAVGVSGESGELLDAIKKYWAYNKPLDYYNVVEELGDMVFYMQGLMTSLGISWAQIVDANTKKLGERYHKMEYSDQQAQERADKQVP